MLNTSGRYHNDRFRSVNFCVPCTLQPPSVALSFHLHCAPGCAHTVRTRSLERYCKSLSSGSHDRSARVSRSTFIFAVVRPGVPPEAGQCNAITGDHKQQAHRSAACRESAPTVFASLLERSSMRCEPRLGRRR